jgi:hypothetical protein
MHDFMTALWPQWIISYLLAWCTIVRWNVTPKHLTVLEDFSTSTGSVSKPGSVLFVFLRPCTKFATGLFFALLQKGYDY